MTEREAFEDWFFGQAVEPTTKELSAAWNSWQSACKWQRGVDAEICDQIGEKGLGGAFECAAAILNQGSKE